MTGTAVQLSSQALQRDWSGLTGQGDSCRTEQCVSATVCSCVLCSAKEDTRVLHLKRHNRGVVSLYLSTQA